MTTFGPRVLVAAVLALLLSFSTRSVAQTAVRSQGIRDVATLSVTSPLAQHFSLALGSWPPWDDWGWGRPSKLPSPPKPKNPPVAVPEGGSPTTYLSLVGLACIIAMVLRQRQTSH